MIPFAAMQQLGSAQTGFNPETDNF